MLNIEKLKSKIRLHFNEFSYKSNNRTVKLQKDNIVLYVTNYDLLFVEDVTNLCCKELYIDYMELDRYTITEIMEKLENFINEIKGN